MSLKEFFLGNSEERTARQTVQDLSRQPRLNRRQATTLVNARRVSRRLFNRQIASGIGLAAAATTVGGAYLLLKPDGQNPSLGPLSSEFTTEKQKEIERGIKTFKPYINPESKPIDTTYLRKIFDVLQREKGTPEARSKAVLDNTDIIALDPNGKGTAIMIDEAGYWLTVAHLVASLESGLQDPNPLPPSIYHLSTGVINRVTSILFDPLHDIAVVFAPTGKPNKPVANMQLRNSILTSDTKLWQIGANMRQIADSRHFETRKIILHGQVDYPSTNRTDWFTGQIRVKDMIPFGGSSGGPIIDAKGSLVALESGSYSPTNSEDRATYTGSTIVPIKYAFDLPKTRPYTYPATSRG